MRKTKALRPLLQLDAAAASVQALADALLANGIVVTVFGVDFPIKIPRPPVVVKAAGRTRPAAAGLKIEED